MNFPDAVRSVLTKYAVFSGRARRSEYWWFFLFNLVVSAVAAGIDAAIGTPIIAIIVGLALLLPTLAVGARRLHDTGRTGWLLLLAIIPLIGAIVLIVFFCQDTQPGDNQYGAAPKQTGMQPAV